MHDDEVAIDAGVVRRLVATQFPHWGELPIEPVHSAGTLNSVYRLGDDLCVRLPRAQRWASDLEREVRWLPRLAPHLPLPVPEPVATGSPGDGYPFRWAIYTWLDGEGFHLGRVVDERGAAVDLAGFVTDLRGFDPTGAPPSSRDRPLAMRDRETRLAIESLDDVLDIEVVTAAWEASREGAAWNGSPVWTHGDLLSVNLLVHDGRLSAVLDFGNLGLGDPAVDVVAAWSVFGADGRAVFREELGVDDSTWIRARGFASPPSAPHRPLLLHDESWLCRHGSADYRRSGLRFGAVTDGQPLRRELRTKGVFTSGSTGAESVSALPENWHPKPEFCELRSEDGPRARGLVIGRSPK